MELSPEKQLELLEKEYFHLNHVVENFDAKSLTIKAWNVTLAGSLSGAGAFTQHYELLFFAACASVLFWFIDTYWKNLQFAHYQRIGEIEAYFAGRAEHTGCFKISESWSKSYRFKPHKRFYRIMFYPHVVLPHGVMSVALFGTFFWLIYS